jgi:hypothetical protein
MAAASAVSAHGARELANDMRFSSGCPNSVVLEALLDHRLTFDATLVP